jgi:hypothetical protein
VCAAPGEAFNILWYVLQIAHAALIMYQCQQVHLNWPYLFQMCASSLMDVPTYGNRFEDSLILVGLRLYAMLLLCMCVKLHLNIALVSYENSGAWVFLQPDFCRLINVCC